jgi:hypothetical protein
MEAAAPYLLRIVLDADDVATCAEVDADQVAEHVRIGLRHRRAVVVLEQAPDTLLDLPPRDLRAVGVGDLEPLREEVAQQSVGLASRLRVGPAAEQLEPLGPRLGPVLEFVEKPALPHPGVGDDSYRDQGAFAAHAKEGLLQLRELGVAADHSRLDALDAASGHAEGARLREEHEVRDDGLVHALHDQRLLRFDGEHAAHVAISVVADAQAARRSRLLHARRDIHCLPANALPGVDSAAEQHAAGVDAHAHVEAIVPMLAAHELALLPSCGEERQAGADRALGIVLPRFDGPEHGQHAVAGVIQHLAAVLRDDGGELRECAVHHRARRLRIELLRERRGADDVEEQDRRLLEDLHRRVIGRRRFEGNELAAQGNDRRIDHRIAENRALGEEPGDGRFELLPLRGHRVVGIEGL